MTSAIALKDAALRAIATSPYPETNETYTFRSYFLMKFAAADILYELGAGLIRVWLLVISQSFSTTTLI